MTRSSRLVVPVLLLMVLIPSCASAQGLMRWLGRLSGPGPFWGFGTEVCLKPIGADSKASRPGITPMSFVGVQISCRDVQLDDRHAGIYLIVTGAIAENNPLNYGDVDTQEESTAVRFLRLGGSIDWTFHKAFAIGAGAGLVYFAGPRFDNFVQPYVQLPRLAFRPLMLRDNAPDHDGWLILSANWQILLGAIDGEDFGAPLDPFRSSNEQDIEFGITIDLLRLAKKLTP